MAEDSAMTVGDDQYNYDQHLKEISPDGLFVGQDGVAIKGAGKLVRDAMNAEEEARAKEEMDADLWAALNDEVEATDDFDDDFAIQPTDVRRATRHC